MTTPAAARARDRIEPYYLVDIALGGGGPTLHFSDRNVEIGGVIYEDYLASLAGLGSQISLSGAGGLNADVTLRFKNDAYSTYTRLIEMGDTYPFDGAIVIISEVYRHDGAWSDAEVLFKGALDEPHGIDLMGFESKVSSMDFHRDRLYVHPVIDEATWPSAYEDLGRVEPVVYGEAGLVPAMRVDWGARTTLKTAITAAQTTGLFLSEKTRFPSSGAACIDSEKISYTSIGSSGELSGVSRAQGSTTAAPHGAGATVWESKTYYDSVIAGHVLHTVVDIFARIGGELLKVESGVSAIESSGRTLLRASAQIKASLAVDEGSHSHSPSQGNITITQPTTSGLPDVTWGTGGSSIWSNNLYVASLPSGASQVVWNVNIMFRALDNLDYPVNKNNLYINLYIGPYHKLAVQPPWNGLEMQSMNLQVTINPGENGFSSNYCEAQIYNSSGGLGSNSFLSVQGVQRTVTAPNTISSNPASAVRVVGGYINTQAVERFVARVKGYKDDASGTITGVPGALIERPDHVIEHFLTARMGFAAGDIDSSSFSAAGSLYASAISGGYKFAFALIEKAGGRETAMRLAAECRSTLQYRAGKWYLTYTPDAAPSVKKTITKDELAGQGVMFRFGRTPVTELNNKLTACYAENYAPVDNASPWDGTIVASDSTSIAKYGTRPLEREFRSIRLKAMAEHVLAHMLLERKAPLLIAEFPVFWEHFDLAPGDTIEISNPLYNGKEFFIKEIRRIDQATATIRAIEWWA